MSFRRRPSRPRSRWRSLADAVVFLALLLLAALGARQGGLLPGSVSHDAGRFIAVDGDSLRKGGREYRLHAIDAPELNQTCQRADGGDYPCGREAKRELARLIGTGELACDILDTDRYRRSVAECRLGTININDAMVRSGWAIAYRRHGGDHVAAEADARKARRGIWQGRFEAPEDWRNARRDSFQRSGLVGEPLPED